MELPTETYTAREIAEALGLDRQAVQYHLRGIPPDGEKASRGNAASAWLLRSLPSRLREKLDQNAHLCGCRDAAHLLSDPPKVWNSVVPFAQASPEAQERAIKLKQAQARALARRNDPMPRSEWEALAIQDYKQSFGHKVSARHCINLLQRTLQRAGPAGEFDRLELYLDERPQETAKPEKAEYVSDFSEMQLQIEKFKDPKNPSGTELDFIWMRAIEFYLSSVTAKNGKALKRDLILWLRANVPRIAPNRQALRRNLNRKLAIAQAKGITALLVDGREARRGVPTAEPYDPNQVALIAFYAASKTEGRRSQAARELNEQGQITDARIKRSLENSNSKSYLPQALRCELTDVPALVLCHQGPKAARKMMTPRELSYEGIFSMDCITGDDLTAPVWFYVPDGKGWFRMTRGQTIIICDFRSLRILSWGLVPERGYTALSVRTALVTAFEAHGLPKMIYREGGIWRKSGIVNNLPGARPLTSGQTAFSECEIEAKLAVRGVRFHDGIDRLCSDLGGAAIRFREAYRANSKPIERVCGMVQDLMGGEPGFCGRDERKDCPEKVKKNLALVESRKAHPKDLGFYSFDQWMERQGEIFIKYNSSRQEGRRLRHPVTGEGLSPDEAFEVFRNPDPPVKLDDSCRFLLTHTRHEVEVQSPKRGRRQFPCGFVRLHGQTFCSEQTGKRVGQKLLAFWDPNRPDACTFTDLNQRNPFTVPALKPTNALLSDPQFEKSTKQAQETLSAITAKYRALESKFGAASRRNIVSPETAELNRHIVTAGAESEAGKSASATREAAIKRKAKTLNIPSSVLQNDEQTRRGLDLISNALAEEDAEL